MIFSLVYLLIGLLITAVFVVVCETVIDWIFGKE